MRQKIMFNSIEKKSTRKLVFLTMLFGLLIIANYDASAQEVTYPTNIAVNKPTTQSSTYNNNFPASKAVDGGTDEVTIGTNGDFSHTLDEKDAWWQVDLEAVYEVDSIWIYNRQDECCWSRLKNYYVMLSETEIKSNSTENNVAYGPYSFEDIEDYRKTIQTFGKKKRARYIRIFMNNGTNPLSLAEVRVYVTNTKPVTNSAAATKEEAPLTPEAKAFKHNLIGTWENQYKSRTTFTEDKVRFENGPEITYKIVDEKTVEILYSNGTSMKATMTFEDNGNTLIWVEASGATFRCKRIK